MTPAPYTEDMLVQQTTAEYLEKELGWESVYAYNQETFGPDSTLGRALDREVVLTRYLLEKLRELNPGLPEEAYDDAVRQIVGFSSTQTLLATNRDKYILFKEGVQVAFRNAKGERVKDRLRVFDFTNYKDPVPHLFHHNAIVMLGNGNKARIGSVSSKWGHSHEWKRLAEQEPGVVDMETLLRGVCSKQNFMDLLENFIVFDDSSDGLVKIVTRNHQFLGANLAVEAVKNRHDLQGKLGVFRHTQGSGKSYSMVFLTAKVRRKLGDNFTFLICTDRDDILVITDEAHWTAIPLRYIAAGDLRRRP